MHYPTTTEKIAILKEEKYRGATSPELEIDIMRILGGEPLEYVLGYTDFLGCRIDLSEHPMIPRPETAFWVAQAIDDFRMLRAHKLRIADVFAGSGNVGIALLSALPHATVDFSELDSTLLPGIARSLAWNGITDDRTRLIAADALSGLTGFYDALVAVPPYVSPSALADLDPDMRDFEPHLAFFADENGRAFHRLLIEKAAQFLKPGGVLYMETDMDHEEGTRAMLCGSPWSSVEWRPDPYGAPTNVILHA